MTNLTSVGVTAGLPTSGTGTVSTIDGIFNAAGGPVGIAAANTPPSTAQPALVVALSPNGVNANGQATMANSAPVVIASDQSTLPVSLSGGTVALAAGAAKIGVVTTDQTTPGTTDLVHAAQTGTWFVQESDANNAAVVAGTGTASVSSATTLFSVDTTGYSGISVQVTSPGTTCTITYEGSNDNSTWVSVSGMSSSAIGSTLPANTSSAAIALGFTLSLRYFRARVSTYTSGTVTVFYALRKSVPANYAQGSNAITLTSTTITGTVTANASLAASATGAYSYNHISTDTTTTVKSGAGTLHTICINTLAATGTATVYDNTAGSGTVIAVITAGAIGTLTYDLAFATGLTIVTAVAAPDITVTYK